MIRLIFVAQTIILLTSVQAGAQDLFKGRKCIVISEFIYQPDETVIPSCHASTITETTGGLLTAWFGGTDEGNPDVGIWISRLTDGKWSRPEEAANGIINDSIRYPCWNPVLYNSGDETLLFYKIGLSPSSWWGELKTSTDNGISWSPSRKLPEGIIGPVKNKPIMLKNGLLLCPSSTEHDGWKVHIEMTSDFGITWEKTDTLNNRNIDLIQPTLLPQKDGRIQMLCRSRQSRIYSSWTEDNGFTWTELLPDSLPNPNSGIDAVTLSDGRHFLVYNHLTKGRNMLNGAISDDGVKWQAAITFESDTIGTEYSYPAVIQSKDGKIHLTYTWNRKLIKHVVIDPVLIETRPCLDMLWPVE